MKGLIVAQLYVIFPPSTSFMLDSTTSVTSADSENSSTPPVSETLGDADGSSHPGGFNCGSFACIAL